MNESPVKLIIGTRGSKLALWQANHTKNLLQKNGIESELRIIKTKGDKIQHLSFDKLEGKGFFTKELEDHLINGSIDIAVHSLKDMPTSQPDGLVLAALLERANPSDWLVINRESADPTQTLGLKSQPIIGTSSARRKAQILYFKSDSQIKDIRGNVPTRLRKLEEEKFDAILLAAAGLERLEIDLTNFKVIKFNPREFIPAPGQGAIAIQTKIEALETRRILKKLHKVEVAQCTNIERSVLKMFDGGCHLALGVHCQKDKNGNFHVFGAMSAAKGSQIKITQASSSTTLGLAEQVYKNLQ